MTPEPRLIAASASRSIKIVLPDPVAPTTSAMTDREPAIGTRTSSPFREKPIATPSSVTQSPAAKSAPAAPASNRRHRADAVPCQLREVAAGSQVDQVPPYAAADRRDRARVGTHLATPAEHRRERGGDEAAASRTSTPIRASG